MDEQNKGGNHSARLARGLLIKWTWGNRHCSSAPLPKRTGCILKRQLLRLQDQQVIPCVRRFLRVCTVCLHPLCDKPLLHPWFMYLFLIKAGGPDSDFEVSAIWFFIFLLLVSLGSAYTVLKFMMMWTLVLLADFILEFRLEYLWPCWLFFGSVYTTFHCHGLVRLTPNPPCCDDVTCQCMVAVSLTSLFPLFAGDLCCFRVCRLHPGHLLSDLCSFALAVLCGQHLCVIQLHMAHRWVWTICLIGELKVFVMELTQLNTPRTWLFQRKASAYRRCPCGSCWSTQRLHFDSKTWKPLTPTCLIFLPHTGMLSLNNKQNENIQL